MLQPTRWTFKLIDVNHSDTEDYIHTHKWVSSDRMDVNHSDNEDYIHKQKMGLIR